MTHLLIIFLKTLSNIYTGIFLLCGISFANQILLVFLGEIPPSELILAYPGNRFVFILEEQLGYGKLDFGVLPYDLEPLMSVDDRTVLNDDRHQHLAIRENVIFKQHKLCGGHRRDHAFEVRIDSQLHVHISTPPNPHRRCNFYG